jgi:hypothetical protein
MKSDAATAARLTGMESMEPSIARQAFADAGYLHLPQVLGSDELEAVLGLVDGMVGDLANHGLVPDEHRESDHTVRVRNAIGREAGLAALVDHRGTLPYLIELLGPYLSLVASEVFIRSSRPTAMIRFHTDGGPAMQQIGIDPSGQFLSAKVQFFLTDVDEPDSGNFVVVDGSHRHRPANRDPHCWIDDANAFLDSGVLPPGGHQILAEKGDAIIFPHALWHAVAPNRSGVARKSVILRYGHLWHRPFDHTEHPRELLERLSDRQRRLLGKLGPGARPKDYYKPADQYEALGLRRPDHQ